MRAASASPLPRRPRTLMSVWYTVASGDTDSFDFVVAATRTSTALGGGDQVPLTTDVAGNVLNATVFRTPGAKHSSSLSLSSGLKLYGLQLLGLKLASPQADTPPYQGRRTVVLENDLGSTTGCLDVQWGEAANGQNVQTWACNGTNAQEWTLEQRTSGDKQGSYRLVSGVGDGNTYCLDNRGDFHDGGRMGIWSCLDNDHRDVANQSFRLDLLKQWLCTDVLKQRGKHKALGRAYYDPSQGGGEPAYCVRGACSMASRQCQCDPRPALTLSVADAEVTEAAGAELTFDVSLNRAPVRDDGTVSVDWATRDGTATAGADYTAASGTLTFGYR